AHRRGPAGLAEHAAGPPARFTRFVFMSPPPISLCTVTCAELPYERPSSSHPSWRIRPRPLSIGELRPYHRSSANVARLLASPDIAERPPKPRTLGGSRGSNRPSARHQITAGT